MEPLKVVEWIPSLSKKLHAMQSSGILCDAVIECDQSEKLLVHSCVLAAASPVFEQALALHGTELISQQKILAGQEFSKHVWELLLNFVYTGQLGNNLSKVEVNSLKDVASKLSIIALEEKIDAVKADKLPESNDIKEESIDIGTKTKDLSHILKKIDVCNSLENSDEQDQNNSVAVKDENEDDTMKKQSVECKQCSQSFTSSDLLQEHCREFHWKYKCAHCGKNFEKKTSLTRHETMVHTQVQEEYNCKHCEFRTKISALYFVHLKKHKQYKCTYCSYEAKSKGNLLSHLKDVHQHQNQKLYRCSFSRCSYSSNSEGSIKVHEKTVHATERSFKCQHCSKLFKTQTDLNRHTSVHNREYICDECGASFARKFSLEDHKRKKHYAEPLTCPQCEILFTSVPLRNKHIREVHEGRVTKCKKQPCKLCGKVVNGMGELRRHMRVHTGEKLYPCNSCSRSFATKNDLLNHKMIHSGEKPFLCAYCPFKCNRQYNLRVHERKHLQEKVSVTCSICNPEVSFRCLDDLDRHTLKEHPESVSADVGNKDQNQEELNQNAILNGEYEIMVLSGEQDDLQHGQQVFIPIEQLEGSMDGMSSDAEIFVANSNISTYENAHQTENDHSQLFEMEEYIEGYNEAQGEGAQNILTLIPGNSVDTVNQTVITNQEPLGQIHVNEELLQGETTEEQRQIVMYTDALADVHQGTVLFLPQQ